MFKRLFLLMLLSATFLSGYYLGRLPGSPDVFAMAENGYQQAGELGKVLERAIDTEGFSVLEALSARQGSGGSQPADPADEAPAGIQVAGGALID